MIWQILIGVFLTVSGWLLPRAVSGAKLRFAAATVVDIAPSIVGFVIFTAITARPVFGGALVFALMGGFAFVDIVKRTTLLEPAVFADLGEAIELFRHPQLYLPFAGPARVIAGAVATAALFAVLLFLEPPAWPWTPIPAILVPLIIVAAGWLVHGPFIGRTARVLRRLNPSGDAFQDAATLGPSAIQFVYSLIARDERPERRAAANRPAATLSPAANPSSAANPIVRRSRPATPVIVIQCESFFDPRRLHPAIPANLIPAFDACRRDGIQSGQLTVPGWGANTTRTEFAVLTGLSEEAVGYDRYNPYFAFARAPVASLASRLRAQGYRTICIHPFDRTFYRRDEVMRNLGFDVFLGEEAFAGATRSAGYVSDTEVARVALELMHEEGPDVFIFGITMENHGPWDSLSPEPFDLALNTAMPAIPEREALLGFIQGVKNADASLAMLTDGLTARGGPGVCAFYGDHLPSFPAAFKALDFHNRRSDYVIWRPDGGPGAHRDLAAHQLCGAIFDAADTIRVDTTRADAGRASQPSQLSQLSQLSQPGRQAR